MLRIKRQGAQSTAFEFRGIKKTDARNVALQHISMWSREILKVDGEEVHRDVPVSSWVVEWQDGDGGWKEDSPTEVIPIA